MEVVLRCENYVQVDALTALCFLGELVFCPSSRRDEIRVSLKMPAWEAICGLALISLLVSHASCYHLAFHC